MLHVAKCSHAVTKERMHICKAMDSFLHDFIASFKRNQCRASTAIHFKIPGFEFIISHYLFAMQKNPVCERYDFLGNRFMKIKTIFRSIIKTPKCRKHIVTEIAEVCIDCNLVTKRN